MSFIRGFYRKSGEENEIDFYREEDEITTRPKSLLQTYDHLIFLL